ncbi:acyl carrier protein [Allokutzneria oryzae]|uniref:Acyl carrier protein n=1 Tax=Allokutzneria oryzae TaxID=1378989 RepID=A0ABV5ZTW4_9PSEU
MNAHTEVARVVAAMAPNQGVAVTAESRLTADLGYDSLRLMELTMALEKHFGLPPVDFERAATVTTVADVTRLVEGVAA